MPALKTDDVLREEARELLSRRRSPDSAQVTDKDRGRELFRKLYNCKFSALCLSGGGIRSASFALGIIQALAAHPKNAQKCLLAQFDYLSTVSGGGVHRQLAFGLVQTSRISKGMESAGVST